MLDSASFMSLNIISDSSGGILKFRLRWLYIEVRGWLKRVHRDFVEGTALIERGRKSISAICGTEAGSFDCFIAEFRL